MTKRHVSRNEGSTAATAERHGRIALTPAVVAETEIYRDEQIERWNREDEFAPGEREALMRKLRPDKAGRGA